MPVAVFNYLLAVRYKQSPAETASMVIVSTLMAFVLLPFLLAYVMPLGS
jgi:predicted permease